MQEGELGSPAGPRFVFSGPISLRSSYRTSIRAHLRRSFWTAAYGDAAVCGRRIHDGAGPPLAPEGLDSLTTRKSAFDAQEACAHERYVKEGGGLVLPISRLCRLGYNGPRLSSGMPSKSLVLRVHSSAASAAAVVPMAMSLARRRGEPRARDAGACVARGRTRTRR